MVVNDDLSVEVNLQSLNVSAPTVEYKTSDGEYGRMSSGNMTINLELTFYGGQDKMKDLRQILEMASTDGKLRLARANPDKIINNNVSEVIKKEEVAGSYASKEVW